MDPNQKYPQPDFYEQQNHLLNVSPQKIIDRVFSPGEFERGGRIRIYRFITLVEEILKNEIRE